VKPVRTRTVALTGAALLGFGTLAACSSSSDKTDATPTASQSSADDAAALSDTPSTKPTSSVSGPNSRSEGSVTTGIPADYTLPQDIKLGTCYLRMPDTYDLSDAIETDCANPHYVEIISTFTWPKEYVDFIAAEWANQADRCGDLAWSMGEKETGSYNWSGVSRKDETNVWAPSAAQISAGDTTGYCAISGSTASTLLVGSAVAGTLENKE